MQFARYWPQDCVEFLYWNSQPSPPGFNPAPSLRFNPSIVYPTASTCALELTLATNYDDAELFNEKVTYGMMNHGGFGFA